MEVDEGQATLVSLLCPNGSVQWTAGGASNSVDQPLPSTERVLYQTPSHRFGHRLGSVFDT